MDPVTASTMALGISKGILEVVRGLLGASDDLRKGSRERRAHMAALFESVSTCLAATAAEIRAGGVPHGRCAELITYAQELPSKVDREMGVQRAQELGAQLHAAYSVEGLALAIAEDPEKEPHLASLEEASGKFLALARLVQVGGK